MPFREFDTVRVTQLLAPKEVVSSSFAPPLQPAVGDQGSVVDIQPGQIGVEDVDAEGYTRWLAYFAPEELTVISRAQ